MSARDGYEAGVPCWVDTLQPDPESAAAFYAELFGWKTENLAPPDSPGKYFVGRLRGRDVAAVGSQPSNDTPPDWNTYIWVDGVEDIAAKAVEAGGTVLRAPFDSLDGGRIALLADPTGAVFRVWQPGAHRGAQLVNEPGAWAMSTLNTPDMDGAKRFYGAVLGWETSSFDLGGNELTMWHRSGYAGGEPEQPVPRDVVGVMAPLPSDGSPTGTGPHWSVNFWVHDADATAAKAAELGGKVVTPPSEGPGFKEAVVADPQGAALLVSQLLVGS
jgi:predicted enzyme related to lactoylglutathione lyase